MAPPVRRKAAIRATRQRASRRGTYFLVALVLLVTVVGVGAYLYVTGQRTTDIVHAQINTTKGIIQIELYQSKTPKTVSNFVNLANTHFYDGLVWHRIASNPAVIQTGDPNTRGAVNSTRGSWGMGGSSQAVPQELDPSLHNDADYLGMARGQDINSATSQFYINLVDNRFLDTENGGYTVFGRVTNGMDVVNAIASVSTYPETSPLKEQPVDASAVLVNTITIS